MGSTVTPWEVSKEDKGWRARRWDGEKLIAITGCFPDRRDLVFAMRYSDCYSPARNSDGLMRIAQKFHVECMDCGTAWFADDVQSGESFKARHKESSGHENFYSGPVLEDDGRLVVVERAHDIVVERLGEPYFPAGEEEWFVRCSCGDLALVHTEVDARGLAEQHVADSLR